MAHMLIGKRMWRAYSFVMWQLNFSRLQAVTLMYTVDVVISQKWCKIEMLLLQTN